MKKLTGLDELMLAPDPDFTEGLPTRRKLLKLMAGIKADNADGSRRIVRIVNKIRNKEAADLVLENDDVNFLQKLVEKNDINLTGWMQGQMLDWIEGAEKAEL